MRKLREQAAEAVQAKGARKAKTRTNQEYLKMSRNNSRTFWSKRKDSVCNRRRRKRRRKGNSKAGIGRRKAKSGQQKKRCEAQDSVKTKASTEVGSGAGSSH
jgi:hypothetical protein